MKPLQPDTLIRNPVGAPVVAQVVAACDAARLWALVGNFAGFAAFIPALSHTTMTGEGIGALRTKFFRDGHCVVEQLNSRDDEAMCMTWTTEDQTCSPDNSRCAEPDPASAASATMTESEAMISIVWCFVATETTLSHNC